MKKLIALILSISLVAAGAAFAAPPDEEVSKMYKSDKKRVTVYTEKMRQTARENIEKYDWAKEIAANAVEKAEKYVGREEELWNLVVAEGLPRFYFNSNKFDAKKWYCRYCDSDLYPKYANYPYLTDALENPWKITCPECGRSFPSNDFGSYYKLGLDEHGIFDPALAKANNDKLVASGQSGYLVNIEFPDKPKDWGVDDGYGYFPGITLENGVIERHNPIAYFLHEGLWHGGAFDEAIKQLSLAYIYTGDARYARTGAILLDRIADIYPDLHWELWQEFRSDEYRGKALDVVWENSLAQTLAQGYDAFYPIYEDEYVISFLSEKAKLFNMENPKSTAGAIRKNAEDGILRTIFDGAVSCELSGNFGMTQAAVATSAIALDTQPETGEWLDWIFAPGDTNNPPCPGGNISPQLVNFVDRDGHGNEAAPGYNMLWLQRIIDVAELLEEYDGYPQGKLYKNPKFAKMFTAQIPLTMAGYYTWQNGDSGATASTGITMTRYPALLMTGFARLKTPELALLLYDVSERDLKTIHQSIFTENPEAIASDIADVVKKYGELKLGSEMQSGYGLSILRNGASELGMYFGRGAGHGHADCLSLILNAYGLNMAPDLGYPEMTSTQPNRMQWVARTLSHNTVMVDGRGQKNVEKHGYPLHFDATERVYVTDVDAPQAYAQTDIYRRTLVMIDAGETSYCADFFRIKGGNDHIYSFHSQSDEVKLTENLNLKEQDGGSYAGADVEWGEDPKTDLNSWADDYLQYPTGSTWLNNVSRDENPAESFAVDFAIKDFRSVLDDASGLSLRVTMLNSDINELALCDGTPPRSSSNMQFMSTLKYMLARRTGENLDSLYTTVYEPYKNERYIEKLESITPEGALEDDRVIKVTFVNRRVDYIVYSPSYNNTMSIDNLFTHSGFLSVHTYEDGKLTHSYVCDESAYTGTVSGFTRELGMNNTIQVSGEGMDVGNLVGNYIYIENDAKENAVYSIKDAKSIPGGAVLDIGDVTLVRALSEDGYEYNIAEGQSFRVPISRASGEFSDMLGFDWAKDAVSRLAADEIVNGSGVKKFSPSAPVSRADMTLMLTRALKLTGDAESFSDVSDSDYFASALKAARGAGLFLGASENRAFPREPITREDAFVLIARAKKLDTQSIGERAGTYSDFSEVSQYARGAVSALIESGIVAGSNGKIMPKAHATRAEIAVIIDRMLNAEV